ncbi:hypothetical protein RclHR1_00250040 [Rhizophagus clarus]|uniref:Glycosyltransferase family 49 protein n=1 Tax=Rhizophagus clarus TaxID=94130 RepID=A0A2Z6R358_9GLOM|nr:hypothetical protein RclHR1_00250040 [Rhizophagus clarus]GET00970.1 glycosyltransferase family 49 protein [Rhizophagus clarus]
MQPSHVIPYYFRATKIPREEDITNITLITENRLHVFDSYKSRCHVSDDEKSRDVLLFDQFNIHSILNNEEIMKKLRTGNIALVVPAFEYADLQEGLDYHTFQQKSPTL